MHWLAECQGAQEGMCSYAAQNLQKSWVPRGIATCLPPLLGPAHLPEGQILGQTVRQVQEVGQEKANSKASALPLCREDCVLLALPVEATGAPTLGLWCLESLEEQISGLPAVHSPRGPDYEGGEAATGRMGRAWDLQTRL